MECGAIQDVLNVCGALSSNENVKAKALLDRIVAMLTKLGKRGYGCHENVDNYLIAVNDTDTDLETETHTDLEMGFKE